jgi:glycosyltransferase involved in cell wall biosynthesis
MTQPCDVSVVISTHNRADLLEGCLRSLVESGTTVRFEVVVVDNASTDGTRGVIESTQRNATVPVHYIREPRLGVSYGRNAGIARAAGRIIAFTDDDIQVSSEWVDAIHQLFEQRPDIDCVGGPVLPLWSDAAPGWLDYRHWSPLSVTDHGSDPFEIDARRPLCLLTSNLAFRRGVFDRIGGFSPEFPRAQDHELQMRFWLSGGRALYSPSMVVHTAVPAERTHVAYHRRWHLRNGRMCARMKLRERTGPDGSLRPTPNRERLVCGVPAFLWRELAGAVFDFVLSVPRRDRARRLDYEMRVRHLLGYILEQPHVRSSGRMTTGRAIAATGMSRNRLVLASLCTFGIVGGSALDIVRDREHWPFSQYPMFSIIDRSHDHRTLRLHGVVRHTAQELPLTDFAHLEPFDQCRLSSALVRLRGERPGDLAAAVTDVYDRYERRREAGDHDGPPLQAVRLYQLHWVLQPGAPNAMHPNAHELVYEYRPAQ